MLRIHYTAYQGYSTPHSPIALTDQACEQTYSNLLYRYQQNPARDQDWCISSENFYNRIRVGIVEGEINHEDVEFIFNEQVIHPNQYGAIVDWPTGFCDYNIQLVERILLGSFEVRRQVREERPLREFGPDANPEVVRIYMTNALRDRTGNQIVHTRNVNDQGQVTLRFYAAPENGKLFDPINPLFTWVGVNHVQS